MGIMLSAMHDSMSDGVRNERHLEHIASGTPGFSIDEKSLAVCCSDARTVTEQVMSMDNVSCRSSVGYNNTRRGRASEPDLRAGRSDIALQMVL